MDTSSWHILRVSSGSEVEVAQRLGIPAYVPRKRIQYFNRRMRCNVDRIVEALPGYLFLRTDDPRSVFHRSSRKTFGFIRNNDGSYAVLTPRAFSALRALERELLRPLGVGEEPARDADVQAMIRAGSPVIWNHDWLGELEAVVLKMRGGRALIEVAKTAMRIEVKETDLRAA